MRLGLDEFRAFAHTEQIRIAPITFVVGENSSGKTSFLAALNYVWRLRTGLGTPFTAPPFDLGSFDEIVHRVRGRKRPDCFALNVDETVSFRISDRYGWVSERTRSREHTYRGLLRVSVVFGASAGDTSIQDLCVSFDDLILTIAFSDPISFKVSRLGNVIFDTSKGESTLPLEGIRTVPSLDFAVVDALLTRSVISQIKTPSDIHKGDTSVHAIAKMHAALSSFLRTLPAAVVASAPVRSNPSRVYTRSDPGRSPEGKHIPQALFRMKKTDQARWLRMKSGIEEFGRLSGMFQKIDVTGFGSSNTSPFQISVMHKGRQSNIMDMGYGVSQALPILTDLIEAVPHSGFLFQQPEVHLHPQAQAALGSLFARYAASQKRATIIAETHSDYMIDRVRYEIRQGTIRSSDASILYFEPHGSEVKIRQISLDQQGNILDAPSGYRDFFVQEQGRILGLEDVFDN